MDELSMRQAIAASLMSRCFAGKVGSCLTLPAFPGMSFVGFNRPPEGQLDCTERGGCLLRHDGIKERCVATVHAEIVSIRQAVESGFKVRGGVLHVTKLPCHNCAKVLDEFGIARVYYIDTNTTLPVIGFDTVPGIEFVRVEIP